MSQVQNTEFNSSFLSLLFFGMVLNPIVLVVVTFYIFRILVYKFCLRLTLRKDITFRSSHLHLLFS